MKQTGALVYVAVTVAMLFWALTYIWYKVVFEVYNPIAVMTFRLGLSALVLFLFSKITGKLQKLSKEDFLPMLVLSFFQPFLYFLAESYGVSMVSSTIAAVIISTIPVFTPYVAYMVFGDRVTVFNVFGIILSFFGVLAVILGQDMRFTGSVLGIVILIGAVMAALGYAIFIVKLANKYNSFTIISWQNLIGLVFFLPLFFTFEWTNVLNADVDLKHLLNLIYLAIFGSSGAYILFTYSIRELGITKASMFTNVIPVFTAVLSYFMLGEQLEWVKVMGIVVVLGGLFMSQRK